MLVTAKAVTALARSPMQYADTVAWLAPEVHLKIRSLKSGLCGCKHATNQQGKSAVAGIGDPISAADSHQHASIIMGIGVAWVAKCVS